MTEPVPPQYEVAHDFMEHKGYGALDPVEVEQIGQHAWIFTYAMPEGELDLKIEWVLELADWRAVVDDFRVN